MSSDLYDPAARGHFAYEPPRPGPVIAAVSPRESAELPRERPFREGDVERNERARLVRRLRQSVPARPGHADVPPTDAPPATG